MGHDLWNRLNSSLLFLLSLSFSRLVAGLEVNVGVVGGRRNTGHGGVRGRKRSLVGVREFKWERMGCSWDGVR